MRCLVLHILTLCLEEQNYRCLFRKPGHSDDANVRRSTNQDGCKHEMIRGNTPKLYTLITLIIFAFSILSINLIREDFVSNQMQRASQKDSQITKAGIAWPRSIREKNDLTALDEQLSNWEIESQFLIFKELMDKSRAGFILLGAKNYQDYAQSKIVKTPKICDQNFCEVIALLPSGVKSPDVSELGLKIIDQQARATHLPIPRDFGVDSTLPILITPLVDQLSTWPTFRYLPATFGWQITPKRISDLSASSHRRDLLRLETNLNTKFSNVTVNFPIDHLDTFVEREHHITSLLFNATKTLLVIYVLCLLLIWQRFRFKSVVTITAVITATLLIAAFWGYLALVQTILFLLLFVLLFFLLNKIIQARLMKTNLNTLALYRSALTQTLSIAFLIGLAISVTVSANQYLVRTQEIRKAIVDQSSPFDFNLKVGSSLDRPLDLGSLNEIRALSGGNQLVAVVRSTASLVNREGDERQVNLVAQGAGSLWQEPELPIGRSRQVSIEVRGIPPEIDVIIWFKGATGGHFAVRTSGSTLREGDIPQDHSGENSIVAFELRESPANATRREHALGESLGRAFDILNGNAKITTIAADGKAIPFDSSWPIAEFSYELLDHPLILRPHIDSPDLMLRLSNDITDELSILKIDDVIISAPKYQSNSDLVGVEKPFIVVDLAAYQAAIAQSQPYALDPVEIWIKSKNPALFEKAFRLSKFSSLKLISREKLLISQTKDPYWRSWQSILFSCLGSLLILIFLSLFSLLIYWQRERRKKTFEFTQLFDSSPPAATPLILLTLTSAILAVPILYLSRLITGLIA